MPDEVVRLRPLQYVHIHDNNTNLTFVLSGPTTYTLPQHQSLTAKGVVHDFVVIPPQHYAVIENPVQKDENNIPIKGQHGEVRVTLGEREIRFSQEPFALYPQEKLVELKPMQVLTQTEALVLRAISNFTNADGNVKVAGDEYLFHGPGVYVPRVEEEVMEKRSSIIVKINENLRLRAKNKFVDQSNVQRNVGEEYLWSKPGAFMLGCDEVLVRVIQTVTLTSTKAIHVEVLKSFVDTREWSKGVERNAGQQYLLTNEDTAQFTPEPQERIVAEVPLIVVTKNQWAVILDPVGADGNQQLGGRKVVTNTSFFLKPGETLHDTVRDAYVLATDESLLLTAVEEFSDDSTSPPTRRVAGELWLISGPCEYIPRSEVRVKQDVHGKEKRKKLILADGEGVYVRNILTGEVRMICGCSYMLKATEELWEKPLDPIIERKLLAQGDSHASYMENKGTSRSEGRDKTRVVSYRIPHNTVTQIYDYKKRTQRHVFGPEQVMLNPDEQFTVMRLSGSDWDPKRPLVCLPKKTGRIQALYLFLGPANLSDVLEVETLDHARLQLQVSYDWYFDVEYGNDAHAAELFRVPDFVGDCCSCIGSRVRGCVASVPFDTFHKHSSDIIKAAVFGTDPETKRPKASLRFNANRLVVNSVDIQTIEVLDERTRVALQQSVKMAIEITTQSQESTARQDASVREQLAKGMLERQQLEDKAAAERERKKLLEYETKCAAIQSTGQAKAEAHARAEAQEITANCDVSVARIHAQTGRVMDDLQIQIKRKKADLELSHREQKNKIEVEREKNLSEIESGKLKKAMEAVGQDTISALARAGPEVQTKLLKGLGLQGYLVTDGTNPINLFNTAQGMTAPPGS